MFIYNVHNLAKIKGEYPDRGHDVDNFKAEAMVAMKFQLVLKNFKASKKIDAMEVYFFFLLRVYLIENLVLLTISMPEKKCQKNNRWIVTLLKTKKIIISMNLLKC